MSQRILARLLAALALWGVANAALAQGLSSDVPTIDIKNGTASAIPITVVPFAFEGAGLPPDTDVAAVIGSDLNRSGQFRTLPKNDIVEYPARGSEIKFPTWNLLKQAYILVGREIENPGGGAIRVEFELFDVAKQQQLLALAITGQRTGLRDVAHQIADLAYEKITGVRGAFWTRIAYVTSTGTGNNIQYALMVADSDGFNPQTVVRSREPLLSPAWSPDGAKLAYVSFERGNSSIYIQEIATGAREAVSTRKGINGAPAFSPDGLKLALTLSFAGHPNIYVMDLASKQLTQLTKGYAIDTEPKWMPDGQSLIFTSDRSGKPQLYQISASGGAATRITFQGDYNANASIAWDGKHIAMVQGNGNVYRIAVLDRTTGDSKPISVGNLDDHPSYAPNGSMLLYTATEGYRDVLYAVSANGRVRQRLVLADGDVREPTWSPYRQRGQ
ncbi:MAG: Tol-Pal system beta propeller repeat protein TolB [Proteobacteria bacterium]|nr:Tol-Pal system beta propeller repeat protein TolB [Pseudomonadota bacterium]